LQVKVKLDTILGAMIIGTLCFFGGRMVKTTLVLNKQYRMESELLGGKNHVIFQAEEGVDATGSLITPLPPPEEDRALVFLLRGASLKQDLEFWENVSRLLPQHSGLRLVAYCADVECANTVKVNGQDIGFPVIIYGEIVGSQAVMEADSAGEAILRSEAWLLPKTLAWRSTGKSPQAVLKEALQDS
jgi:hypothetical protein